MNDSIQMPPLEDRMAEYAPPEDPIFVFEVEFSGGEVERLSRMLRSDGSPIINDYLHNLAFEAVDSWEQEQSATSATSAD